MSYDTLRKSAFPHKLVTAVASAAVVLSLLLGAAVIAGPASDLKEARYRFNYSVGRTDKGEMVVRAQIIDSKRNEIFAEPSLVTRPGVPVSTEITREGVTLRVEVTPDANGEGRIDLVAREGQNVLQQTFYPIKAERTHRVRAYSGDPISINLRDADLKDVLRTFSNMTGLEITTDPDVKGTVNMSFKQTPWDEALDRVIKEAGYTYRLDGKRMHVYKP